MPIFKILQNAGLVGSRGRVINNKTNRTRQAHVWTTVGVGDLNTAIHMNFMIGMQYAALSFGGRDPGASTTAVSEEYNGSSWYVSGSLNTAVLWQAGAGTQTAGLSFGGTGPTAETEEYDGSAWATAGVGDLNTARHGLAGTGSQGAALCFGGYDGAATAECEEYNGSSWAVAGVGDLNTARHELAASGNQHSALSFGGYCLKTTTEEYDGATWSTGPPISFGREILGNCGSQTSGLTAGGTRNHTGPGTGTTETEEYI